MRDLKCNICPSVFSSSYLLTCSWSTGSLGHAWFCLKCCPIVSTSHSAILQKFLGATKHLYNWLCPLVGLPVCLSVCLSVMHSFDNPYVAPIGLPGLVFSKTMFNLCLLYTSPSPRDGLLSRMPSSA